MDETEHHIATGSNFPRPIVDRWDARKLHFRIPLKMGKADIERYLRLFGPIHHYELDMKNYYLSGFVVYDVGVLTPDTYELLLDHRITDLNDSCLTEIFQQLNLLDLSTVAHTTKRFRVICGKIFKKKHTSIDFHKLIIEKEPGLQSKTHFLYNQCFVEELSSSQEADEDLSIERIERCLTIFGGFISTLRLHSQSFNKRTGDRTFKLLIQHCSNLKSLTMTEFRSDYHCIRNDYFVKIIHNNLHELNLNNCHLYNDNLFENCNNLTRLEITRGKFERGDFNEIYLAMPFPKLQSISLRETSLSCESCYRFIELNPQLKSLDLVRDRYSDINDQIFERIGNYLPELESLSIHVVSSGNFSENLNNLLKLEKLRQLILNVHHNSVWSFIARLGNKGIIELLHITDGELNEQLTNALCGCKSLRSLKLISMRSVHNNYRQKLANLPNLVDFQIVGSDPPRSWNRGRRRARFNLNSLNSF